MHWDGPILTDSGGYQVMSLAKLRKLDEDGVTFQSHLDGASMTLTPERAIEMQCLLGADIQMVLDECTPFPATHDEAAASMQLSMRWAERSKQAFGKRRSPARRCSASCRAASIPICADVSAEALIGIGFDGYAIGGLAVGEGQAAMLKVLDETVPLLPQDRPRYLMGVGKPEDMLQAVARGIDMFDCVMPTRSGRHCQAFTWGGQAQSEERALCRGCVAARCRRVRARPRNMRRRICIISCARTRRSAPCCSPSPMSPSIKS